MSGRLSGKLQAQPPLGRIGDQQVLGEQFANQLLTCARRRANDPGHFAAPDFTAQEDFPQHRAGAAGQFLR